MAVRNLVIGVDEAGRGCAWGSVFAGAVILPEHLEHDTKTLRDSKKLSEKRREESRKLIETEAIAYGVGECTAEEIDSMNILNATFTAMHRAISNCLKMLNPSSGHVTELLIDGNRFRMYLTEDTNEPIDHRCIIHGDDTYPCISAASILAKTYRDEHVKKCIAEDPSIDEKWGMASHKGYCTKRHIAGLQEHGAHELHRKTYAPVRAVLPS